MRLVELLEEAIITPISKNEGIRTAMAIVEEYYADCKETEETD